MCVCVHVLVTCTEKHTDSRSGKLRTACEHVKKRKRRKENLKVTAMSIIGDNNKDENDDNGS